MKKIFIILSFIILFSCNENEGYNDLSGKWEFTSETYQGSFTLNSTDEGYQIKAGAVFQIEDQQFITVENIRLDKNVNNSKLINELILGFGYNGMTSPQIWFEQLEFDKNFESMTSQLQNYNMCDICDNVVTTEKVIFSRK